MQKTKKVTATKSAVASKPSKQTKKVAAKAVAPVKTTLAADLIAKGKKLIAKLPVNGTNASSGIIKKIMQLYTNGFTKAQIVAYGFNRSTVYRQTRELDKLRNLKNKKLITGNGVVALTATSLK